VGVNAAVVQRNEAIFGENAGAFVPERWLGGDAARRERYMFQVSFLFHATARLFF
jgi:hypothetical protein